jgi:hypothetical protein
MKLLDYFTIGKLDVIIEPLIKGSWEDVNEAVEIFNAIEDVGWRLPTLDELKSLHENKSVMKFEMGNFWFFDEDAPARIYVEGLGVWKVKPTCKFPAILVKDTVVNSDEL